jgi:uncharacterized membrane protein
MTTNATSGPLYNWTQGIYGLHALSLLIGILGAATIVGAFLTGWPSIIAVILNYVKRGDVRGTWLESHFRWQIRTFWFGLLWGVLGAILLLVLVGYFVLLADAIWIIYRIVKGWLNLSENKPLYLEKRISSG